MHQNITVSFNEDEITKLMEATTDLDNAVADRRDELKRIDAIRVALAVCYAVPCRSEIHSKAAEIVIDRLTGVGEVDVKQEQEADHE